MSIHDPTDAREKFTERDERQLESERRRERMERCREVTDQELADKEADDKCEGNRSSP